MLGRAPEPSPAGPQASPPSSYPQTGLFPSQGPPQVCHVNLSHDSGQMKMSSPLPGWAPEYSGHPRLVALAGHLGYLKVALDFRRPKED